MNTQFKTAKYCRSDVAHLWTLNGSNPQEPFESLCGRISVASLEYLSEENDKPVCKVCCAKGDIVLKFSDLSLLQQEVLEFLGSGESFTRKEIKEGVGVTVSSTLTRILKRLDSFGLIECPFEEGMGIHITQKGMELLDNDDADEDVSKEGCIVLNSGFQSTVDLLNNESEVSNHSEFDWIKSISLEYVKRLKGETDLEKIKVYSNAAYSLSMVYLNLMEPIEVE